MMAQGGVVLAASGALLFLAVWLSAAPAAVAMGRSWFARMRVVVGAIARGRLDFGACQGVLEGLFARFGRRRSKALGTDEQDQCLDELSELIDVVALGLTAGVSFDAALQIYCARYKTLLAELLGDALRSWRLGMSTRREALAALARRLDVPAFTVFVDTVCESLEFGAPLASALVSQAEVVRDARRSALQEQIEKAPVKMLVPTGTLVLPAMLLAIMGPLLASLSGLGV